MQHQFLIGSSKMSIIGNRINIPVLRSIVLHVRSRFPAITGAPTAKDNKIHLVAIGVQKALVVMPIFEQKLLESTKGGLLLVMFPEPQNLLAIVLIWYGKRVIPAK